MSVPVTDAAARPVPPEVIASVRAIRRAAARRRGRLLAVLGLLVVALAILTALVGATFTISAPDFLRILGGAEIPGATYIATTIRVPRIVVGAAAGIALGVSGALFQSLLRNPIASPDVMGISQGASAGAVLLIVLGGSGGAATGGFTGAIGGAALMVAATAGALTIAGIILAVGRGGEQASARTVLAGVGIGLALTSLVSFLLTRTRIENAQQALVWMSGSLSAADASRAVLLPLLVTVLLLLVATQQRAVTALRLGDDVAAGLGTRPGRARRRLLILAVLLAAVATACVGPITFVAFAAGPIARRLPGGDTLTAAGLVGAAIVLAADWVGANALPASLPVGLVTGVLGAPFLLWLIVRSTRSRGHDL